MKQTMEHMINMKNINPLKYRYNTTMYSHRLNYTSFLYYCILQAHEYIISMLLYFVSTVY